MLATPGLSAGSWLAPPRNAKSIAITGTDGSCTSHASMPPGEITRSMLVACAGAASARADATTDQSKERDADGHERLSSRRGCSLMR